MKTYPINEPEPDLTEELDEVFNNGDERGDQGQGGK